MNNEPIIIRNARTHNLKNINLEIPRGKMVVFTGVSGSGKSSLVFDTIYTEAQRQLIDTFSSFARRRLPKLSRPPVDEILNISTAIIIDQKRMGRNLRSTVGTATEIYTYLRLLFSRCAEPYLGPSFIFSYNHPEGMCQACKGLGKRIQIDTKQLLDRTKTLKEGAINHPDFKVGGWNWREMNGIDLFRLDVPLSEFTEEELEKLLHADGIPIEKKHGAGTYSKNWEGVARRLERLYTMKAEEELSEARKTVYDKYFIYSDCDQCYGTRLNERARSVKLNGMSITDLADLEMQEVQKWLLGVDGKVALPLITKMQQIIGHLIDIGVGYLSLGRSVATLSGGESQRVKMARQLDCDLVDLLYILDEPSIGLHPKDGAQLITMLKRLRDKGNSVLVVEHDTEVMASADWIIDIGPAAGKQGGEVLFAGTYNHLKKSNTITGTYLRGNSTELKDLKTLGSKGFIPVRNANIHNLKNIDVDIPLGIFTCITGVAGSGKSSLIHEVFVKENPGCVVIDQSPIGKSSRSIPVMYIGIFDRIRKEIGKAVNADPSLFSFNSKGACPKCKGAGSLSIEMSFMDEVRVTCDECNGQKFNELVLRMKYKGLNIYEILNLTVEEAVELFEDKEVKHRISILDEVGLGYLEIGQSLSSLSGGEAQRIKLASELHKKGNIYIMDEPTTGLHMADIEKLMVIIHKLVGHNNTVIVIEHNLDVIRKADWIIDMGPEGGAKGGEIIATGTPEQIARVEGSWTGRYLNRPALAAGM